MKYINESTKEKIDARIRDDMDNCRIGGASWAVYQDGKEMGGILGVSDVESGKALRGDSIFRLASMSKPITAVAVMRQYEKGLISPDDDIDRFIPAFANMGIGKVVDGKVVKVADAKNKIKVAHLMNHRSGLLSGDTAVQYGAIPREDRATLEKVVNYYSETILLDFDPDTSCFYSGVGAFDVLSRLVEITSGKDYNTYLREEIFEPLGMKDATFLPTEEQRSRFVTMHYRTDDGKNADDRRQMHIFEDIPATCFSGGAGLCSTLPDYMRFARMLLNGGTLDGAQILKPETIQRMITVPYEIPHPFAGEVFGLGMRVIIGKNRLPLRSFGWSGAYGTHFFIDQVNNLCAAYMKNSRYDGGSGAVTAAHFEEDLETSLAD